MKDRPSIKQDLALYVYQLEALGVEGALGWVCNVYLYILYVRMEVQFTLVT